MASTAASAGDRPRRKRKIYTQLWFVVLVAIAAGIVFGLVAPEQAKKADWLADAFLQLIKTVTGPVIFVTVVIGISSLGNLARAGGLALRALGYFLVMTVIALVLGLLAGNIVSPGSGLNAKPTAESAAKAKESIDTAGVDSGIVGFITNDLLPTSFLQPFVDNKILQILVIAILTAAAISFLTDDLRKRVVSVFEVASRVIFGMIRIIMWAAPIGAFGGMAFTVAQFGSDTLANLGLLMVTFWGTCAIFVFGVLGIVSKVSGFSILRVIRLIRDELLIIVGTSSSETVLPRLLAKLQVAGASKQSVGLVIPTGYSFNLDGTCIYLTLGALFIVQAAGQDMAIGEQIALAALMVLTSKGAAGITGAGLVTLTASLQAFGGTFFSAEAISIGIALVVGIDRIMSEGRALTNAIGNATATLVISKWAGELDEDRLKEVLANPSLADDAAERAMAGDDLGHYEDDDEPPRDGRFTREREAARRLVVPVHRLHRERGQAHGDVLGPLRIGGRVAHPLAGAGEDRLPGAHVHLAALVLDVDGALDDDRVLVEVGALAGLDPARGGAHVRDAHALLAVVHPPGVLVDQLRLGAGRLDAARRLDQLRHRGPSISRRRWGSSPRTRRGAAVACRRSAWRRGAARAGSPRRPRGRAGLPSAS